MKINHITRQTRSAFTLIEMIGVLAVIAILAAVLIPKVFEAINNSRVNNAAMGIQTVKTACIDHYAKFGSILGNGTPTPYTAGTGYDTNLLAEGFLEKPFLVKIGDGTGTTVQTIDISSGNFGADDVVDGTLSTGFDLAGSGSNNVVGSVMIVATITGVDANDRKDLNDRIDGPTLGGDTAVDADLKGRVKFAAGSGTNAVHVYLTHR